MSIFKVMKVFFYVFSFFFLLTSCVEIIDDISINEDGSGTFKYSVNLSSSKVKINSILALDSLDGKKVPSLDEISLKLARLVHNLETKEGISNVEFSHDYTNFIFKLSCNFSSVEELQNAIKELVITENNGREIKGMNHSWITFEGSQLTRSIPQITLNKVRKFNQDETKLLQQGKYTSITRFKKEIDHFDNQKARLSKNKKAIMVQTNPYALIHYPQLLDNTIYLKE